ncbi:MAG: phosphonoacetaldehyde reductase [Bacteroidales bacterium]|nr:phosphonoacetaldehyde reductase [Bacteroidales bacterium]
MQQILWGISSLSDALSGSRKVLLVCDSSYPFISIGPRVESAISGVGSPLLKFSDFASNPLEESVLKGVDLFTKEGCDTLVAVGGGSSIDVAKCIKLYAKAPETKLIAIPTTAGTGSESTRFAVIYAQGKKQSITDDCIVPDFAILEPSVLESLPLYQKKCTMMDALCQGLESWWSVNSTDASRTISRRAVQMILSNWCEYLASGGTHLSGGVAMEAANLAGQAICITQTTAPHAFSYKLTSMYGLPHGHAVAICLPEIWDFMLANIEKCSDPRGAQYLQGVFEEISQLITPEGFRALLAELELTAPSAAEGDIAILAASVNPIRLANNPVPISQQEAGEIYSRILKYHI